MNLPKICSTPTTPKAIATYNPNTRATHIIEHATTDHGAHYAHRLATHLATADTTSHNGYIE